MKKIVSMMIMAATYFKNEQKMRNLCVVAFMVFIFAGCAQQPLAHYSIASTNTVPINLQKGDYFEGESCVFNFLGIPFGSLGFRESKALSSALEQAQQAGFEADALSNVTIEATAWTAILFGESCIKAKGQVVSIPKRRR